MPCSTLLDHEWSAPRVLSTGVCPVMGPWTEYEVRCESAECGRRQRYREFRAQWGRFTPADVRVSEGR